MEPIIVTVSWVQVAQDQLDMFLDVYSGYRCYGNRIIGHLQY
jgi:hypothetical protein